MIPGMSMAAGHWMEQVLQLTQIQMVEHSRASLRTPI
jgi:hypothetical protein